MKSYEADKAVKELVGANPEHRCRHCGGKHSRKEHTDFIAENCTEHITLSSANDEIERLKAELKDAREENDKLKAFVREFIKTECWGYQPEIDGCDVQEVAEEMGIIVPVKATREKNAAIMDEYDLEEGDTIYHFADWMEGSD